MQTVIMLAGCFSLWAVANLAYQVAKKPSEMLSPMAGTLVKTPAQTWREYGPLFHRYSTSIVTPELLAALAQTEGAGDPIAHTYWRWRLGPDPFAIFRPASSAVGMYQMTNPAFEDARRFCIRQHAVVPAGKWNGWPPCRALYARILPGDAVELAAVSLDRGVRAILKDLGKERAGAERTQDLAALIHLCGHGPASAFARRGFRLEAGERCGDHDAGAYLTRVEALRHTFLKLAAAR